MTEKKRCAWCNLANPLYVAYHDTEWGRPQHSDAALFELLILEGFQAGLSWECVLNKRAAFRAAFDNFDCTKVAKYSPKKLAALLNNAGIIRNRAKIAASVTNAQVFLAIQQEFGSFDKYLKTFTRGKVVYENDKTHSPLSDALSKDLQKRGMKFVGTTIIYSYLQAIGAIYSHSDDCYLYKGKR